MTKSLLPQLIELFHDEELGVTTEAISFHCRLLNELESAAPLTEPQNHSAFVIQLLASKKQAFIAKSIRALHYTKDQRLLSVSQCRYGKSPGYMFEMDNSVDFVNQKRTRTVHLGSALPPLCEGAVLKGSYKHSIGKVKTLFSASRAACSQEAPDVAANEPSSSAS